jgi:ribosomal protein S27AE
MRSTNYNHRKGSTFSSAMQRSAERRRCPNCDRKSALVRAEDATYCRWDCGYWKWAKHVLAALEEDR